MTDRQRIAKLNAAVRELKQTRRGFVDAPNGPHWRKALAAIEAVASDLGRAPVPALGPVIPGGKPILLQDLTHRTDGLDLHGSVWPAFDDGIGHPGMRVIAPEALTVTGHGRARRRDGRPNGQSINIAVGASGIEYWVGHLENLIAIGTTLRKGGKLGTISPNHEAPHVHFAINAVPLIGHDLLHHTNYTHGAPLVGVQLTKALAS